MTELMTESEDRFHGPKLWTLLVLVFLAGAAGRALLLSASPRYGYVGDHFDNIGMGLTAERFGLLQVYSVPPEQNPVVQGWRLDEAQGGLVPYQDPGQPPGRRSPRVANYPPLGVTIFYLQTKLLGAAQEPISANTLLARVVMAAGPMAFDLALAVCAFLLARAVAGGRAGVIAACICWAFPPIAMDSALWGQTDSWPLVPAMLMLLCMIRRRWVWAGVCLAAAVLLKTQGVLLAPVLVFGAGIIKPAEGALTWREFFARAGKSLVAAAAVVAVVTAPWTIATGADWVKYSFLENFSMYPQTTLKAFNIWYMHAMHMESARGENPVDVGVTVLGLSLDMWGKVLVAAALAGGCVLAWRRLGHNRPLALVVMAGLWTWSTFMLPTRVHERYIILCVPMVIVAACCMRGLWPAVIGLAIVGAAELSSNMWITLGPDDFPDYLAWQQTQADQWYKNLPAANRPPAPPTREEVLTKAWKEFDKFRVRSRGVESLVTVFSIVAYVWFAVQVGRRKRQVISP